MLLATVGTPVLKVLRCLLLLCIFNLLWHFAFAFLLKCTYFRSCIVAIYRLILMQFEMPFPTICKCLHCVTRWHPNSHWVWVGGSVGQAHRWLATCTRLLVVDWVTCLLQDKCSTTWGLYGSLSTRWKKVHLYSETYCRVFHSQPENKKVSKANKSWTLLL